MELKYKEYKHEIEMQKLKSQSTIEEKNKELEGNVLYGIMGDVFKDFVSGIITKLSAQLLCTLYFKIHLGI